MVETKTIKITTGTQDASAIMAHQAPTTNNQSKDETETRNPLITVSNHKLTLHQMGYEPRPKETIGKVTNKVKLTNTASE